MPRISTDNYDTVASWNGSQDLFVVEQPDGTKVATPAMVKQFIEAGDFEATGEVKDGHGNILDDLADQISELNDEIDALNTYQSGDWTARKYNDGAFECWRHYEKTVAANTVDVSTYLDLPSEIVSTPECVTLGLIAGGADYYAVHMERKTPTQIRLAMINQYTAATTIGVDIHVYGRWK